MGTVASCPNDQRVSPLPRKAKTFSGLRFLLFSIENDPEVGSFSFLQALSQAPDLPPGPSRTGNDKDLGKVVPKGGLGPRGAGTRVGLRGNPGIPPQMNCIFGPYHFPGPFQRAL